MSATITQGFLDHKIFSIVSEVAAEKGVRAFVIGGYVRDCFLGRPSKDIDIVVEGSGIELAQAVGEKVRSNVSVFKNFGTAMLRFKGIEVEFVGARKESYRRDSRKPIVEDGTLEDDQLRRDFTINAMAFSLQKEDFGALVDPFGGIRDLAAGIIRTPLDPDTTYSDDPLRMVRAIRFATKLSNENQQFNIVPESLESIRRNRGRMEILSKERIVEELNKILITPKPSIGFRLLDETGLLDYVLPQLSKLKGVENVDGKGHKENFSHTLEVLDNVAALEMEAIAEGRLKDFLFEDGVEVEKQRTEPNVWQGLEAGTCGGIQLASLASVAHIDLIYIVHQLQRLLLTDILKEGAAKVVGNIIFAVRKRTGTAESTHNATALAADTGFYLLAINRTVALMQAMTCFKYGDLQLGLLLDQFIRSKNTAGAGADNNNIVIHK